VFVAQAIRLRATAADDHSAESGLEPPAGLAMAGFTASQSWPLQFGFSLYTA
jgi:hypothetical protein